MRRVVGHSRQDAERPPSGLEKARKKIDETRLWLPAICPPGRFADLHAALEEGAKDGSGHPRFILARQAQVQTLHKPF
jgi:hypothetical protein